MNQESFRRASELFEQLCDLPDGDRDARLETECAGDEELRVLVVELLRSDRDAERRASELSDASFDPRDAVRPSIPGYTLEGRIGEGGMGVVWRAIQTTTRRAVALKILSSSLIGSERDRARFDREVELAASLEHPNIARVYDSGVAGGFRYYAMELVDGVELDRYVSAEALDERRIVELFERLCRAIEHAHRCGVIHRDLKPSNVLVRENGQPVVVDFGLAKSFDAAADSSSPAVSISLGGHVVGTPSYMSPEQAAGGSVGLDTRTDVYSLGVMLFRALSGRFPHDHDGSTLDLLRRIADTDSPSLARVCPTADRDLVILVAKALARERDERYGSAGELAADLDRWLKGEPLAARAPSTVYILRKRLRRHRVPVMLAAMVLIGLIAGGIAYVVSIRRSREAAERWAYGYRIQLAERSFSERNPYEARSLLSRCPLSFRNWEWDFLWSQLDRDRRLTTPPDALDVDYSRDGTRVVLGRGRLSSDFPESDVLLMRTADDHVLWRVPGEHSVEAVAFTPDEREIWVGRRQQLLERLDAATGELLAHEDLRSVRELVFSPDGRQAAIVPIRQGLVLRDMASGEQKRIYDTGVGRVRVSYSADSSRLLWTYDRWRRATGFAVVVDAKSGEVLRRWERKPWFSSSAIHPRGDTAFLGDENALWIWDLETGARQSVPFGRGEVSVACSRSGDRLYVAERGAPLSVWSIGARVDEADPVSGAGSVAREVELLWSSMTSTAAESLHERPDRQEVFATGDRAVRFDVTANPLWRALATSEPVNPGQQRPKSRLSPDGSRVALTCSRGLEVRGFPDGRLQWAFAGDRALARSVSWSADGDWVVSAWGGRFDATRGSLGKLRIHESATGTIVTERELEQRALALEVDPAGRLLAVFTGRIARWMPEFVPGELSILALPGLEPLWSETIDEEGYGGISIQFSPNGRRLALETGESLRVWDLDSREPLCRLGSRDEGKVTAFAYHPSGRSLVVAAGKDLIELNAGSFERRRVLSTVERSPECLAFSPDGSRLVVGARRQLTILDVITGERLLRLATDQEVSWVEFSPDSEFLLTAGDGQSFRAWRRFGPE